MEIAFSFADNAQFAGERFKATAEAADATAFAAFRRVPVEVVIAEGDARDALATARAAETPTIAPVETAIARFVTTVARGQPTRIAGDLATRDAARATVRAARAAATAEATQAAEVRNSLATVVAAATAGASPHSAAPRAAAATLESIGQAARAAEDSIDEIFISRRAAGEPGRWMKSGWKHYSTWTGNTVLQQAPAAAFIQQLSEVEEFAVLVTHDSGDDTAAVFDVRYLDAALISVGWDC